MIEHLPECWAKDESDPPAWCICDELRACETRVLDAAVQRVEALICIDCLKHLMADDGWATCFYCVGAWEALAAIKNKVK
jgi:hypothetical protein